ncbi:MAG: DUF1553 domain-containing protein [Pirellulaceae bacterium]
MQIATLMLAMLTAAVVDAADEDHAAGLEIFEKHVRPTLVRECIRCHGDKKQQGGLRLDTAALLAKGGDSGDAISIDDPSQSHLIRAIRYEDPALEMPPRGKLPQATIAAFEKWIELGAPDPRNKTPTESSSTQGGPPTIEVGRKFWSFQPIASPRPPSVADTAWARTTIDQFVLARIEQAGMSVVDDARPHVLARRAYYDLTGLPPTPAELHAFVKDPSPNAYENLIDRLLDSPKFGERWGRHWLDVVRFAQSSGGGRTLLFPNAWRYRDYVIDSLNRDLPFDKFIREQIAGDLLEADDWQDKSRKLVATAYLLLGPTNYELQDKDVLEMDVVDEQLDTIGKSFLGMTIGCARCHDHKFDPIPAEDYYALAGILRSTKAMIHSNVSTWNKVELPVSPEDDRLLREKEKQIAVLESSIKQKTAELERLGGMPTEESSTQHRNLPSSSIAGIVVDDAAAELVGQWTPSTSAGPYVDGKYIHDGTADKGNKSATFRPDLPREGSYDVRVVYSPFNNRATSVPVHIHHAAGESVVRINQKQRPQINGAFTSVGVFHFDPEQDPHVVISTEDTTDGVVIADAVVFVPTDLPPLPTPDQVDIAANIPFVVQDASKLDGIVVDDTQAVLVGQWKHSVHTPPFVGASYQHDLKESKGEKSATFTPTLPSDGIYEVRIAHNTNVRRANGVPVTVRHADGEAVVKIDEGTEAPIDKLFRSVGEFKFVAGRSGSVTIGTEGTDGKYVIIDAVQFIPVGDQAKIRDERRKRVAKEISKLNGQLTTLQNEGPHRPTAMVTGDDSDAGDIPLAIRGVVHNKGPIVPRGVLQVASSVPRPAIAPGESGRRELADWIANPNNPLTSRVIVNRAWHWLFGRGIVESVDNFGSMGSMPTHPQLLDHLATQFVENDWSIKQLIREIMLSHVYQLGTDTHAENEMIDPDNKLLWRMNRKRLRAEDFRDTLLYVAGTLDESAGGPNVAEGTNSEYGYQFLSTRRSVYVPVFRNTLPQMFEAFDFADPNIQRGRRTSSTIAPQALLLMNHPDVIKQTRLAANRLLENGAMSDLQLVQTAYLQVLCRDPSDEELRLASEFLRDFGDSERAQKYALLYQTLLQCLDFRYLN